jgi:hypothetical protein
MPTVLFSLANIRTGSGFLARFFAVNARDCTSRHEPWPDMFGPAVLARTSGQLDTVETLFSRKAARIDERRHYCETSHAFLKSFAEAAVARWPGLKLIHPVRDPREVARSAANRRASARLLPRWYTTYRGSDGGRYWRWALSGTEELFGAVGPEPLTMFQWYVVEWIEIENRAMRLLDKYGKHGDCFGLDVPTDLSSQERMRALLAFAGMEPRHDPLVLRLGRNGNFVRTRPGERDQQEFAEVVARVPRCYREIFARPAYARHAWARLLVEG